MQRLREQQKKEEVKRLQEEEKYRRQESDEAFQAWLRQKMEDDQRRKQDESSKEKDGKEDRVRLMWLVLCYKLLFVLSDRTFSSVYLMDIVRNALMVIFIAEITYKYQIGTVCSVCTQIL